MTGPGQGEQDRTDLQREIQGFLSWAEQDRAALRRKIVNYLIQHDGEHLTPHDVARHFRLPGLDGRRYARALMQETAGFLVAVRHRAESPAGNDVRDRTAAALSTTEALQQLLECVTGLVASQTGLPVLHLLNECGQCRNRLLYLLDTPAPPAANRSMILARIRGLPEEHQFSHGDPDSPDSRPPQIRGIIS
jgi:hypothetical protein